MTSVVFYINGIATTAENIFNVIGYLPRDRFSEINDWATTWRFRFGAIQAIAGAALCALGFLVDWSSRKPDPQKYLTLAEQMVSLGFLSFNHGIFNIARSYAERSGFGVVLSAYDFYGRKILPPLAPSFDLQGKLFEKIRRQFDRIHFITLFPPEFCLRS